MAIELKPIQDHIKQIDAQMLAPLPTPPIGTPIVWFRKANPEARIAAIVTGIEDSGKLKLVAFPPFGMPEHKQGVSHVSDKIHERKGNPASEQNGSWDYAEGKPAKAHFDHHLEKLAKRKAQLQADLDAAKIIAEREKQAAAV